MVQRALVTGWFSFRDGEATAGDLGAAKAISGWLEAAGIAHDVAYSPALAAATGTLCLDDADPAGYTDLVFACGPLEGPPVEALARRFDRCRRLAVGVSVVGEAAHLFDAVLARDGEGLVVPDLAFLDASRRQWPLVALVAAHDPPDHGARSRHRVVNEALRHFLEGVPAAVVEADTRIDPRSPSRRATGQLDALLRAADVVVTTQLHGLVLALRNGTPVVAVDPIDGGAEVRDQATVLGWQPVLLPDEITDEVLSEALDLCLHPGATHAAEVARAKADGLLRNLQARFQAVLAGEHA